jgi:NAD(P)-dependent dehydrogenase (short-subunit alcohol dehydrogenase family)
MAKEALPMLRDKSSLLTLTYLGSLRNVPNYNTMGLAKASLEASVRYIAGSVGPKGIRANGISAGPIKTLAAAGIKGFSKILEGEPVMLVYKGFVKTENLQKQKLTIDELEAVVREHGIEKIEDAELVMLERDGSISVISKELKNQTIHQRKRIKKYGDKNTN